ncbi:hypothetical protein LF1_23450 [Rubripirellula obstinata]|uniref:Uncharacterized protein n=1 Tax=Rubripirellula obstinata TaxID=406547 RepID=A0A5B1CF58_9BACT|nr:hypothetical protein LF1_23450 [Rubripirellula obstinata]
MGETMGGQNDLSDTVLVVRGIGREIVGSECGLAHRVEPLIFANRTLIRVLDGILGTSGKLVSPFAPRK